MGAMNGKRFDYIFPVALPERFVFGALFWGQGSSVRELLSREFLFNSASSFCRFDLYMEGQAFAMLSMKRRSLRWQ